MPEERLRGIFPPVVLPLGADGGVDRGSLANHVGHLVDAGVHGLWMNGSTGEFHALDPERRAQAVEVAVKVAGGSVPVVAHVGDTSTGRSMEHARAAVAAGAEQLALVAPYFVDFTQRELLAHFTSIATEAGVPVFVYHLPQLAGRGLSVDSIVTLAREGVVSGVKDSGNDMVWFRQLLLHARRADVVLPCFTGGSSVTDLGLYLGAAGSMSSLANLTPRHLVRMYDAAAACDWPRLRAMQEEAEALIAALQLPHRPVTPSSTAAIYKYVLTVLDRIEHEHAEEPLAPLDAEEKRALDSGAVPIVQRLEQAAR